MNLSESDLHRTIAHIIYSFDNLAKSYPSVSVFNVIQQTSCDWLQGLAFLFTDNPEILELIESAQEAIKKTEFQPDGVGRSSAQPSGDVGQGGILDFASWINLNIDELNCEIHETGLYSECDFDFDVFYSRRYESYVLGQGQEGNS